MFSDKKILVAYFSKAGQNYLKGEITDLEKGNTEVVAEKIAEITGADIFKIDPVKEYPEDYNACVKVASDEWTTGARPEIKGDKDISGYDAIVLGYPNWMGTMPMAVWTFLEGRDFSGKTVIPFCTNEGSGMGRSEKDLEKLVPGADVKNGYAIRGASVGKVGFDLENWLGELL